MKKGRNKIMLVFGNLIHTEQPTELFKGTLEECREYIKGQDLNDYEHMNIDYDNGEIYERIK